MQVLGIDIGFGFTKATNGHQTLVFKSLFGEAADLQFSAHFGENSPTDQIHVTIDGMSYFIGDLAEQQSTVLHYTLDQDRLISDFVRILALTVAGMLQKDGPSIKTPLNVVSGLPIGYFKQNHKRFSDLLTGHHTVIFHTSDGRDLPKEIYINKVRMLPQPLGSILNLVMDDNSKIVNNGLAEQKVGVVDIGFRTTDLTILDHLRYIDRGSRTIDTGISRGFGIIADKLREKCGIGVELYRLYAAAETGIIKIRGQGFGFAKIRDQVFAQLAGSIANDIERLWADDWDIDTIVLTGGGCRELAQHLAPLIAGNIAPVDPNGDPRLNNVLGYLKYGRYLWGNPADDSLSPASESKPTPVENEAEDIEPISEDELSEV